LRLRRDKKRNQSERQTREKSELVLAAKWIHAIALMEETVSIKDRLDGLQDILAFDNWPVLLMGRLFDRDAGFVVYRKNGMDILIDHRGGDENGTRYCIARSMYRKYISLFELPNRVRVLDIGAMGGGFPLLLRVMGIELDRGVSVEMNPLTYQRLQVNLATNLGLSYVALNAAVCGMPDNSELQFKPSRGSTSGSIYTNRVDSTMIHDSVRTTTLQVLCEKYFKDDVVDICKIDIEGAEYELIETSPDDVLRKIRYLIVELHDPAKTPALVKRIVTLGFREIQIAERENSDDKVRAFRGPGA
jgi:FkbM family methyltransferase